MLVLIRIQWEPFGVKVVKAIRQGINCMPCILRAVMFADFMAMLFCSVARRENRRIASYVTVFAKLPLLLTPLTYIHVVNTATGQKNASESRKCGRAKYKI